MLSAKICIVYAESRDRYGSPRVHEELLDLGVRCGGKRTEYEVLDYIELFFNKKRENSAIGPCPRAARNGSHN